MDVDSQMYLSPFETIDEIQALSVFLLEKLLLIGS